MKCLIADKMHESIQPLLHEIGVGADYRPDIKRGELLSIIEDYEGLIIRSKTMVDEELLAKAKKLQFIGRAGAGVDLIDVAAVEKRNIQLFNAPEGNRDALAEHMMGMLLAMLHHIPRGNRQVRQKIWLREENRGFELAGKTVGIIGYGYMGQAFAKRLRCFDCQILAFDKEKVGFGDSKVREAELSELFAQVDILSIHIPLDDENYHWLDEEKLRKFKKPIYLLNSSRGQVVSLQAVLSGLKTGAILGAALDVLENEKLDQLNEKESQLLDELFTFEEVLFTPHVAGWTYESYEKINQTLVNKIKSWKR